jgi:sulfate transport system ATP-binding protein
MHQGQVEQVGTPQQVWDHPASPFVYGFLGDANQFHGHAHAGRLTLGGISLPVPEYAHAEHAPAVAFVRPHELSVHRPDSGVEGMAVRLERVLIVGPIARLELIPTHVPAADAAVTVLAPHVAPIEAHLPADAFHAQAFTPGELLIVAPKKARVFLAQD